MSFTSSVLASAGAEEFFRPSITLPWASSNSFSKGGEAMSVFITVVVQAVLIVAGVAAMGVIVLSIATQGLDGTREEEIK